jgi:hypothetical protein
MHYTDDPIFLGHYPPAMVPIKPTLYMTTTY